MPRRRPPALTLLLVAVTAMAGTLGGPLPRAAAQTPPTVAPADEAPVSPSSAELDARAAALRDELAALERDLPPGAQQLAELDARRTAAQAAYDEAVHRRDATAATMARYAVSAYIGGNVDEHNLGAGAIAGTDAALTPERRHLLAVTVRAELLDDARRSADDLDRATNALDAAEADEREAHDRHDAQAARHDAAVAELAATEQAAAQARELERVAKERARAKAAADAADAARARRLDLRPGTHRPLSVHSGVVPPLTVRPEVVALFRDEIPPTPLDAYWRAAALTNASDPPCAIDWALIAAIGKVETSHGTYGGTSVAADGSTSPTILGIPLDGSAGVVRIDDTDGGALDGDPEFDRAVGPMQFIPATWRAYAADGNGDGVADPHNVYDAAVATGTYLCRAGGGALDQAEHASRAVYAYNNSAPYNVEVLTLADHYRRVLNPNLAPPTTPPTVPPDPGSLPPPASPGDPTTTTTTPTTPTTEATTTTTA